MTTCPKTLYWKEVLYCSLPPVTVSGLSGASSQMEGRLLQRKMASQGRVKNFLPLLLHYSHPLPVLLCKDVAVGDLIKKAAA